MKLPVASLALRSYCERVEYSLTNLSFASYNPPYKPVRPVYEKKNELAFNFWYSTL